MSIFFPESQVKTFSKKISRNSTIFQCNHSINECLTGQVYSAWDCYKLALLRCSYVCLFLLPVCLNFFSILISFSAYFFPINRWVLIPNGHSSRIHINSDFLQMMVIMIMMMIIINSRVVVVVASTEKQDRAIYAFTRKKFSLCFHSSNY